MSNSIHEISDDVKSLAHDTARNLESGAAGIYDDVRKGVTNAMEQGKDILGSAYKRALHDGRAADRLIHNNLYQTLLLGIGAGIVLGYLYRCQNGCRRD